MSNTIADNLDRLLGARDDIAAAITAKGGTVASGAGLEDFAAAIADIPGSSELPTNFLLGDGTAYIKTGIVPNSIRGSYYVEFMLNDDFILSDNSWYALFGGGYANTDDQNNVMISQTYGFTLQDGNGYENKAFTWEKNKVYGLYKSGRTAVIFKKQSSPKLSNPIVLGTSYESNRGDYECYLFARNLKDVVNAICVGVAISRFVIYNNTTASLVADYIPATNPSTSNACMYDRVTGTYKENAAESGSFSIISVPAESIEYAPTPIFFTEGGLKGDQVVQSPSLNISDGITIETCFMITDSSVDARQYQRLAEIQTTAYHGYNVLALSNDNFEVAVGDSWIKAQSIDFVISKNIVHTASLVVESSRITKLYVDGELIHNAAISTTSFSGTVTHFYSNQGENSNRDFLGTSYATRFYLRPLTAKEVTNNYQLDQQRFATT